MFSFFHKISHSSSFNGSMSSTPWTNKLHIKCRNGMYPRTKIKRFPVPDDKVNWNVPFENYDPVDYTSATIFGKPWADPAISTEFSVFDEPQTVNRKSFHGEYKVVDGFPRNPMGRTGIKGRGLLGRWGPNHAADFILTKWREPTADGYSKVLEFLAIQRDDGGEWAIPGGMVDPGESPLETAVREFVEEAIDDLHMENMYSNQLFSRGEIGYVDDPRNTDNAWMETTAINYHVQSNEVDDWHFKKVSKWMEANSFVNLYASHKSLILLACELHKARW